MLGYIAIIFVRSLVRFAANAIAIVMDTCHFLRARAY